MPDLRALVPGVDPKGVPMTDLIPYAADLVPTRAERRLGRELERVRAGQVVAAAREVARVQVIAEVTEAALLATSHVSVLESLLATRTPRAEERLRHIADAGALGMTEVVLGTSRKFR
jgi:hypothetical protein